MYLSFYLYIYLCIYLSIYLYIYLQAYKSYTSKTNILHLVFQIDLFINRIKSAFQQKR